MKKASLFFCLFIVGLIASGTFIVEANSSGLSKSEQPMIASAAATIYAWEPLSLPAGMTINDVTSFAVHPTNAYTGFLATNNGLYKTTDAGQSWTRLAAATLGYVFEIAIAPSNSQRLYARSWNIYRSDDGGSTWNLLPSPPSACGLATAPSDQNRVYAKSCGGASPAVFRSSDAGQSWIAPTASFTPTLDTLVVSPIDANVLIASEFSKIHRSGDGGLTWSDSPIGTYFFGRPAFDPQSPYTLYLGHWTGLFRSADGGQTWQDGDLSREFSAVIASPFTAGEALGGNASTSWRIGSSGNTWNAAGWDAPLPLQSLWRSVSDNRLIYARSSTGLWRYIAHTVNLSPAVFLPLVAKNVSSSVIPASAQQAIDRLNTYRTIAGVMTIRPHSAIVAATQNHANYHMLNYADSSAWPNGPHSEATGKPGFTGTWPSDRITAAGFPWGGGSEVMHFIGDPISSVDGWMATVFHRVIMLDPGAHYTGYGYGKNNQTAVDVMDFGGGPTDQGTWTSALPYPLAYPANGQTNVPYRWGGGEGPSPLPPGASTPVGYPFTLQGVRGTLLVSSATLRNNLGQTVTIHPNPPDCPTFNCFAAIAVSPLNPNTTYTVQVQGAVGGVPFNQTWTFTTGTTTMLPVRAPSSLYVPPSAFKR